MDLHYAGSEIKVGGGRKRRQQGGDATFTVLDHILSSGLDSDAFQTACRADWETLLRVGEILALLTLLV